MGTEQCCLAHLSPVVIDNNGALLLIHGYCAHVALPCGRAEQRLGLRRGLGAVLNLPSARLLGISLRTF